MRLKHFNDFLTDFLQLHSWLLHIRISCHWHEYHTLWVRFLSMTFPYKNLSLDILSRWWVLRNIIFIYLLEYFEYNFFHLMWLLCSNRLILIPCSILYYNIIFGFLSSVGEGFVGGGFTPPLLQTFWFPTSFFKIQKRFFASVIKIVSGIYGWNFSFFTWVEGGFRDPFPP